MAEALKHQIEAAFDEPACATNRAKDAASRRKGCSKALTPGAAAGGCAFDGAKIALQPIVDAAHLVHAPLGCEGNAWDNRGSASSGPELYRTGFTTDLTEMDIVMGQGEKKLFRAIREVIEQQAPAAVFVYATCVTALIGDDIEAVCKAAAERFETPVIPVNVPGYVGSKNLGNRMAGEVLFKHVIGTLEPQAPGLCDINLIGDFNLSGELWQVKPLLDRLGIRVLGSISGDARYRQVAMAHRARVSMLFCAHGYVNLARKLQETYGIPYFEGSFYGISDTSDALRTICRMLADRGAPADLIPRCEALIAEEEARTWATLEPYRPRIAGRRVLLYTGGHKTWSVVSALQELGMEVVGTSMRKATPDDRGRVVQIMGTEAHMFDNMAPREMFKLLREARADVLMSGARSQFVALKARVPWIDVNQEKHEPYAGYMGMVQLVKTLDRSINNPVWADLRAPAPWEV
ncbi:nitrogenase iron-molybdenum cofactor biosynthesis protein NifE [Rhodobacter veldkampii DSM 11550]|uniref:Nitrogenase iron-molybdenum cofactor biosynthesis protein NifE n=1 Tax=Phaeovulum veldkampii DSM 11550 TaxID=1185920 RepID=A0A2T4JGF4_9RHOB|nr:nitrogenase iron-molybdenum cofactor biosynthesis protein NifE [Phaeovulum veldkampii]MBK5947696.1 nitrogenase iron-molybdenum cofactor biosynthesis protein NifE [Phaeovulum veldkampii DSM 11550]PTE16995.1 nitrogenase iron-molybdenum cofactor biosynthesis protein NifE [Phaeovulum veldkampii DSM 11550]TDQ56046.1 nitrogenase molybdenum-cofactor synthesis protein NifE [Phaeovulum veldkampii DSM 11550]